LQPLLCPRTLSSNGSCPSNCQLCSLLKNSPYQHNAPTSFAALSNGQEQPTVRTFVWGEIGSSLGSLAGSMLGIGMDLIVHSLELAVLPLLMAAQPRK
jgi:hypothetical protein